jgi:proteasome lid subunit RPN8/RPN11
MRQQLLQLAEDSAPFEMIGLLGAASRESRDLVSIAPAKNHSPTPRVAFYVEPYAEQALHDALSEREQVVVGVYHSHLTSDARPSRSDLKMCRPGWLMVIVNHHRGQVRAFDDEGNELELIEPAPVAIAVDSDGDYDSDILEEDSVL